MQSATTRIRNAADFGQAVRARRKELGYTQRYVAELTGISASFISDLENGKPSAELGRAIDLANILGMNVLLSPR